MNIEKRNDMIIVDKNGHLLMKNKKQEKKGKLKIEENDI